MKSDPDETKAAKAANIEQGRYVEKVLLTQFERDGLFVPEVSAVAQGEDEHPNHNPSPKRGRPNAI